MSKTFERNVHLALHEYLNQLGLLFKYQSGFRLLYSYETAMIELVDRLLMNMDNGLSTGLSLIDFRKPFYLVDHDRGPAQEACGLPTIRGVDTVAQVLS